MRHCLVIVALALVFAAWQSAWPSWACVAATGPDLTLAVVVCVALLRGPTAGAWTGLLCALLVGSLEAAGEEKAGGAPIGGLMVSHILTGYLVGGLRTSVVSERPFVAGLTALVATPLTGLVEAAFVPPPAFVAWLVAIAVRAPYTAALAVVIYLVARPLLRESRPPPLVV